MTRTPLDDLIRAVETATLSDDLVGAIATLIADSEFKAEDQVLNCLVQILGFNNPGAAGLAMQGLIRLGPPAVTPLLSVVESANYGARAWAVCALASIGDPRSLPILEDALATDIAPSVRRAAARGLGSLRLEALEPSQREQVVERALLALERGGDDAEWVVRYAVAVGLESLARDMPRDSAPRKRSRSRLEVLSELRSEAVPVVRLRAQLALKRLEAGS